MRVFWIVIDSFGIGAMPDAAQFGDEGSDTYGNLFAATGVELPNLVRLGLNNIEGVARTFPNGSILQKNAEAACRVCPPCRKNTREGHNGRAL